MKTADHLILVEWSDSATPVSAWHFLSDLPEVDCVRCKSVGWIVGESDDVIMLAPNLGDCDSFETAQACGCIRIPKVSISRRVTLLEEK